MLWPRSANCMDRLYVVIDRGITASTDREGVFKLLSCTLYDAQVILYSFPTQNIVNINIIITLTVTQLNFF